MLGTAWQICCSTTSPCPGAWPWGWASLHTLPYSQFFPTFRSQSYDSIIHLVENANNYKFAKYQYDRISIHNNLRLVHSSIDIRSYWYFANLFNCVFNKANGSNPNFGPWDINKNWEYGEMGHGEELIPWPRGTAGSWRDSFWVPKFNPNVSHYTTQNLQYHIEKLSRSNIENYMIELKLFWDIILLVIHFKKNNMLCSLSYWCRINLICCIDILIVEL